MQQVGFDQGRVEDTSTILAILAVAQVPLSGAIAVKCNGMLVIYANKTLFCGMCLDVGIDAIRRELACGWMLWWVRVVLCDSS